MSTTTVERTSKRMLHIKKRITKQDAWVLRKLILADGYVSKRERTFLRRVLEQGVLDDEAFEVLLEVGLPNNIHESATTKTRGS